MVAAQTLLVIGVLIAGAFLGAALILSYTGDLPVLSPRSGPSTTYSISTADSSNGLRLDLKLTTNSSGGVYVTVDEYNTLDSVNNVTAGSDWGVPVTSMNNVCSSDLVGYVVYDGNYGSGNFSQAAPLKLNPYGPSREACTSSAASRCVFSPLSDAVTVSYEQGYPPTNPARENSTLSVNLSGYWLTNTPQGATFVYFPPGTYTVVALDQWGEVALLHFYIQSAPQGGGFLAKLF